MKPKVYIETTIVSYLTARPSRDMVIASHQQLVQEWWQKRRRNYDLFISQLVVQEASVGDKQTAQKRIDILKQIPLLELNEDVVVLARELVEKGPLPVKAVEDALHIAIATVHGMDYLLTWNCSHIANASMRTGVLAICYSRGFEAPVICTPEELLGE